MTPASGRAVGRRLLRLLPLSLAVACAGAPETPAIVVGGLDYTFDLPSPVPSGPLEIAFENRGEVRHELILALLRPGATLVELTEAVVNGEDRDPFVERMDGILVAEPAETGLGRLIAELEPGRTYALICTFRDTPGDPTHVALGMIRTFEVPEAAE